MVLSGKIDENSSRKYRSLLQSILSMWSSSSEASDGIARPWRTTFFHAFSICFSQRRVSAQARRQGGCLHKGFRAPLRAASPIRRSFRSMLLNGDMLKHLARRFGPHEGPGRRGRYLPGKRQGKHCPVFGLHERMKTSLSLNALHRLPASRNALLQVSVVSGSKIPPFPDGNRRGLSLPALIPSCCL